ncbi:class F sortase [Micromonospora sp. WMMA2032]|nr:class F sortase [Micromonospora sp. WMMA2032]
MDEHTVPPPGRSRLSGWALFALPPAAAPPATGPRSGPGPSAAGPGQPAGGPGAAGAGPAAPARPWSPPPAASPPWNRPADGSQPWNPPPAKARPGPAPLAGPRPWTPPPADPPPGHGRPSGPPVSGAPVSGPPVSGPPVSGAPAPPQGRDRGRGPWSKPLAVVLVLVGVFATGAGLGRTAGPFDWTDASAGSSQPPPPAPAPVRKPASLPVRLAVPAIKVTAPVTPVGQARDGSVDVPPLTEHNQTGWYDRGAVPGEPGRAIIVGHVDTKSGPAVFYRLHSLKPGARIQVTRSDRTVVTFKVDSVEYFDKANLPAARVYGDSGPSELRLITCGGEWVGGRTGYEDNVIVFASRVP